MAELSPVVQEISYPLSAESLLEARMHCAIAARNNGLRLLDAIARPDIQKKLLAQGLEPIRGQVRLSQLEVGDLRVVWYALQPSPPKVTVANVNTHPEIMQKPNSVYVGRHNSKRGLRQSPLHNPFSIGRDGDRNQVCEKCLERVIKPALETRQGAVWMELDKLSDRLLNGESLTLVCYCAPERCHAMDIANALNKLVLEKKGVASPVMTAAPYPAPTPIAHSGATP